MGFFQKIKDSFKKTREIFVSKFNELFSVFSKVDERFLENLEEILVSSDISMEVTSHIIETLKKNVKNEDKQDSQKILEDLKNIIVDILDEGSEKEFLCEKNNDNYIENNSQVNFPEIILMIGVNGTGKTTTIAKLAYFYRQQKRKVLLAAGDTFRAGAGEQLDFWARKCDCDIVLKPLCDPGAVIYEALEKGFSEGYDVILCDTSGRLHNNVNLMSELEKIHRIILKKIKNYVTDFNVNLEYAMNKYNPYLVIDGSFGQNSLLQAIKFLEIIGVKGIIITKLDGTSRGGAIVSIKHKLKIPIKFIGVGEKVEDIEAFDSKLFVDALF